MELMTNLKYNNNIPSKMEGVPPSFETFPRNKNREHSMLGLVPSTFLCQMFHGGWCGNQRHSEYHNELFHRGQGDQHRGLLLHNQHRDMLAQSLQQWLKVRVHQREMPIHPDLVLMILGQECNQIIQEGFPLWHRLHNKDIRHGSTLFLCEEFPWNLNFRFGRDMGFGHNILILFIYFFKERLF